MHTHLHRFALAVLVLCGVLGAAAAGWPAANGVAGQVLPSSVWPVAIQHRQFMLGLLGAMLVLSTLLPALRLPAIAASVLSKVGFVAVAASAALSGIEPLAVQAWIELGAIAALLAAAAVFWREARTEARWDGVRERGVEA